MQFLQVLLWWLLWLAAPGRTPASPRVSAVCAQQQQRQIPPAACLPTYRWAYNVLHQSPCLVAARLRSACVTGPYSMDPLPPGTYYPAPAPPDANPCECSTVVYSLVSACADCQSQNFLKWSAWRANCMNVYISSFASPTPADIVVPRWAFLDVTTDDLYNVTDARTAAGEESNSTGLMVITAAAAAPSTFLPSSPAKGVNVAGLVFALMGGLIMFTIVGAMIFRQARLRRNAEAGEAAEAAAAAAAAETAKVGPQHGGSSMPSEQYRLRNLSKVSQKTPTVEEPSGSAPLPQAPLPPRTRNISRSASMQSSEGHHTLRQPSTRPLRPEA